MALFSENGTSQSVFRNQQIAIIGYGSQARAHALNMKDQGFDITIGLRKNSKSRDKAEGDGHKVAEIAEAAEQADLIAMLIPDMAQEKVFEDSIRNGLKEGNALLFAHGFTIHYDRITPPKNVDVILVAPKGPGDLVRREFERGRGVPCLHAVYQDFTGRAEERAICYADGIGGTRGGILPTTFAEETETDLFGEQAVLCGGVTELVCQGYETLVEAGYQPEVAYFECLHELKLIVDLLHEGGMAKMHDFISETAKYGDFVSGPRVINAETKERMRDVLKDIQSGKFARDWVAENEAGQPHYKSMWQQDLDHPIEKVGKTLRARMPWLNPAQSGNM